jgi:alpha-L-fucosidase
MDRRDFVQSSLAALPLARHWPRWVSRPVPSAPQLAWQRDEWAMFIHFGVNTFTDREWGDGSEDPRIFNPLQFDATQWARTAKAAGFKAMILTAKHHDGFCLWPTETTTHSVIRAPYRFGQADIVGEFVQACRAEGLRPGLYLSPWDRNAASYGDSPRYNDFYVAQLTELLTRYGPLAEVWFDGANGEGPNGRRQQYDWPRYFGTVKRLQPEAVIFSDAGPDVRWIGNERGSAGDPCWSMVDPSVVPYPGAEGDAVIDMLQHGSRTGTVWRPGETDVSIRPGWFYHPAEDAKVKSLEQLLQIHCASVGRNSKLLLNVPPGPNGLMADADRQRLEEFRSAVDRIFRIDLASGVKLRWRNVGKARAAELDLGRPMTIGIAALEEAIESGQTIARYRLEGEVRDRWQLLSRGETIGYRKLDRFDPVSVRRVRLVIEDALDTPKLAGIRLYAPSDVSF